MFVTVNDSENYSFTSVLQEGFVFFFITVQHSRALPSYTCMGDRAITNTHYMLPNHACAPLFNTVDFKKYMAQSYSNI